MNISRTIRARDTKLGMQAFLYLIQIKFDVEFCHGSFRPRNPKIKISKSNYKGTTWLFN